MSSEKRKSSELIELNDDRLDDANKRQKTANKPDQAAEVVVLNSNEDTTDRPRSNSLSEYFEDLENRHPNSQAGDQENRSSQRSVESSDERPANDLSRPSEANEQSSLEEASEACLEKVVYELVQFRDYVSGFKFESTSDEITSKDYLLPTKKADLFTEFDSTNKDKIALNFMSLANKILTRNAELFDESDRTIFNELVALDNSSRSLFLLLCFKRQRWTLAESINRFPDREASLKELVDKNLLITGDAIQSLEEALYVLEHQQVNEFCKDFKINVEKSKAKMISKIVHNVRYIRPVDGSDLNKRKLNEAKRLLDDCYKVNHSALRLVYKLLLLYFQPPTFDKNVYSHYMHMIAGLSDDLFRAKFFKAKLNPQQKLYSSPSDLNDFVTACFFELKLNEHGYSDLKPLLVELLDLNANYLKSRFTADLSLDVFLRKYTAGGKVVDCLSTVVEKSLIRDATVREVFVNCIHSHLHANEADVDRFKTVDESELDEVTLEVRPAKEKTTLTAAALRHYSKQEKDCESLESPELFNNLYFVLFKDQIFADRPDAFRYPFQKYPLDLGSNSFYEKRQTAFQARLAQLSEMKKKPLIKLIKESSKPKWVKNLVKQINFEKLTEIVYCINQDTLIAILRSLARFHSPVKASSPNLVLYNFDARTIRTVHVKRSDSRIELTESLWLSFLESNGIPVELAFIEFKQV